MLVIDDTGDRKDASGRRHELLEFELDGGLPECLLS